MPSTVPNPAYTNPTYPDSPITGDYEYQINPASARMIWKEGFEEFEIAKDFWSEFEGSDPMSLIQTEEDTSKEAGQQITFSVKSGFFAEPHRGDQLFENSAHFESLLTSAN